MFWRTNTVVAALELIAAIIGAPQGSRDGQIVDIFAAYHVLSFGHRFFLAMPSCLSSSASSLSTFVPVASFSPYVSLFQLPPAAFSYCSDVETGAAQHYIWYVYVVLADARIVDWWIVRIVGFFLQVFWVLPPEIFCHWQLLQASIIVIDIWSVKVWKNVERMSMQCR